MATSFTALKKSGLERSTLQNKALTMLIELISTFLSTKWYQSLQEIKTTQIVFDIFNQNLEVIKNFVMAVEVQ